MSFHAQSLEDLNATAEPEPPSYTRYTPGRNPFLTREEPEVPSDPSSTVPEKPRPPTIRVEEPTREISPHPPQPTARHYHSEPNLRSGPGLQRGLQVPSRISLISWGFSLPPILVQQGVTREHWKLFTHEIKSHGKLGGRQWAGVFGTNIVHSMLWSTILSPLAGNIIGGIMGYKNQKEKELSNFTIAHVSGAMDRCLNHWNISYFQPLGLHVLVATPGMRGSYDMDVSSTKLFRYQQKMGVMSSAGRWNESRKERRYEGRESRDRTRATVKARIIVLPYAQVRAAELDQLDLNQQGAATATYDNHTAGWGWDTTRRPVMIPSSAACTHTQDGQYRGVVEGGDGTVAVPGMRCH